MDSTPSPPLAELPHLGEAETKDFINSLNAPNLGALFVKMGLLLKLPHLYTNQRGHYRYCQL